MNKKKYLFVGEILISFQIKLLYFIIKVAALYVYFFCRFGYIPSVFC